MPRRRPSLPNMPAEEKFRHYGSTPTEDGCWRWNGPVNDKGYGVFTAQGVRWKAYRFAYDLANEEPAGPGEFVLHSCDNPRCVNPGHLSIGDHRKNQREKWERGRVSRLKGLGNPNAKIDHRVAREIRERYENGERNQSQLARDMGLTRAIVRNVLFYGGWQ